MIHFSEILVKDLYLVLVFEFVSFVFEISM